MLVIRVLKNYISQMTFYRWFNYVIQRVNTGKEGYFGKFLFLFCLFFFWWDQGFNSGLHTCKAGALPLEPHLQSIWLWLFWGWDLSNCLPCWYLNSFLPISASQVARIIGVTTGARHETVFYRLNLYFKKIISSWALVAHACNPCYSGGRDQEDRDSKPAQGK
jgi:hypothetical protein